MSADSTPHKRPREEMFREALDYAQQTINGAEGRDPWLPYEETWFVIAEAYISLFEQLETRNDLLRRLRQWDMLVGGIGADGRHHEATADAPYWRNEIDRVLYPADSPNKAAGGWCERHGGYLGQRCATCALEVADSAPASSPNDDGEMPYSVGLPS